MAAAGGKALGGRPPTLGCATNGLNWIHDPLGQNRVAQHHGLKTVMYGNDYCTQLRIGIIMRLDPFERGLIKLSVKYLNVPIRF